MSSILSFKTLKNISYVLLLAIDFITTIKGLVHWSKLKKMQNKKQTKSIVENATKQTKIEK